MKSKLITLSFIAFSSLVFSQTNFNCISHDVFQKQMKTNPEFKKNQEQLELETANYIQQNSQNKLASLPPPKIIPIVFHIIHNGTTGNISDAQIIDQVAILNKEFLRMQADTTLTPVAFKPLASAFNVEFRLPTIDPNGNCTNGIDRIYNSLATCSYTWDAVKSLSYWPNNKYLNIWLIETMHYPGSTSCNGGGYSSFPGGPNNLDGIVMRGDLIGSIGTALTTSWGNWKGRYLIHELGHWFNLRHIWGDANCGNDFVNDTPIHETSNSGCPNFPRKPFNTCGTGANGEMYTNYMDYTNGNCLNMFSIGQVARMDAAINSSTSGRNNLWSTSNLIATGTDNPYSYPSNCAAVPEIFPYGPIIACVGDSVKFTEYAYGGNKTSRTWNFFGQPASSLTDSIVKVKYNNPGIYNVSLTITNSLSSKTNTFTSKVYVINNVINSNYTVPFTDGIENTNNFYNDWVIVNLDNDSTWKKYDYTAYNGSSCVGIRNFGANAPLKDELISPVYDLSSATTATLNFRLHFTARTTSDYDKLAVYMSTNCGQTWSLKYTRTANSNLNTVTGLFTTNHIPPINSSEWRQESISLPNTWGTNPVRFKFQFISGGGNNIFIDDINLNASLTTHIINENNLLSNIKIYPNPSENQIFIESNSSETKEVSINLVDITGKSILNFQKVNISDSPFSFQINSINSGLYFLEIKSDNTLLSTQKIIISK